jgi:hypothetical protein
MATDDIEEKNMISRQLNDMLKKSNPDGYKAKTEYNKAVTNARKEFPYDADKRKQMMNSWRFANPDIHKIYVEYRDLYQKAWRDVRKRTAVIDECKSESDIIEYNNDMCESVDVKLSSMSDLREPDNDVYQIFMEYSKLKRRIRSSVSNIEERRLAYKNLKESESEKYKAYAKWSAFERRKSCLKKRTNIEYVSQNNTIFHSDAEHFVDVAIDRLEAIRHDDPLKKKALDRLVQWITDYRHIKK